MRRRLYFMLPDVASGRRIRDELLLAKIEDSHIHVLARDDVNLGDLHEASILQKPTSYTVPKSASRPAASSASSPACW
jgi:hypothetical protein